MHEWIGSPDAEQMIWAGISLCARLRQILLEYHK